MAENNNLTSRKVYNILYIGDYTKNSPNGRKFVDSIINNLLDKPASKGWTKIQPLPPITVSMVEIAESRQQAFEKLKAVSYDVVIVDYALDGSPNGAGTMSNYRDALPTALYIPLFMPFQLKGAIKKDGTVSEGLGLQRLYDKGFYNGFNKRQLNLKEMIELIHAGGRSEGDAYIVYGLNYGRPKLEESTPTAEIETSASVEPANSTVDEKQLLLMQAAQLFPEFSINQVQTFLEDADYNMDKLHVVSSMFHTKVNLPDPYGWVRSTIGVKEDTVPMNNVNESKGQDVSVYSTPDTVSKPDIPFQHVYGERNTSAQQTVTSEISDNSSDEELQQQPLNRKQRRAQRRKEREQELAQALSAENVSDETVKPSSVNDVNNNLMAPANSTAADPFIQEMERLRVNGALQERGTINNGLVKTGVIHGNVIFAKGSTVIVELPVDIETFGLRLPDVYNAPVCIPYSIFGMGDLKRDE